MRDILLVTFPFFALVLCGYLAAIRRVLPVEAVPGLNLFVLYFALPCMLFRFAATTPIVRLLDASVGATYVVAAMAMVTTLVLATRARGTNWKDASLGALVGAFPNSGFMGVPLLVALLGPSAAGPTIVCLATDMVVTSSLCIALSRLDASGDRGAWAAVGHALKGMLVNPLPWSIALGCVATATGWELPAPAMRTVEMLANGASPVALFTIGTVLARSRLAQREQMGQMEQAGVPASAAAASPAVSPAQAPAPSRAGPASDVPWLAAAKLLLHPLLVFGVGRLGQWAGVPLEDVSLTVLVLVAALPSANNVPMLAERFGADTGRIARVVLWTTACAFVTFSAAVGWLGGR